MSTHTQIRTVNLMIFFPRRLAPSVSSLERQQENWDLARYDVLIVDELSMVPVKIFDHVRNSLNELHARPVLILCSDQQQQQPIETVEGKMQQTSGVLYNKRFYKECVTVNLLEQFRCRDPLYQEYLNIRYFKPTSSFLHKLFKGRTLCKNNPPTEQELANVLREHSDTLILTVSRRATHTINRIAVEQLFAKETPLAHVKYDNEIDLSPIYKEMKVVITQNRDKKNGVVNRQTATVLYWHQKTIILKLPNNNIVAIHQVTERDEEGNRRTVYPIVPAYATTTCKIQGQTFE